MSAPELVFMAVPGFVSRVTGVHTCELFYEKREFDPAQLIKVDLAREPNQVPWSSVQVDAHRSAIPNGLTSLGPDFHLGTHRGAVYLEIGYYNECRKAGLLKSWPPSPDLDHQYMSLVRWGSPRHTRFHGYQATVLAANGSVAELAIDATQNEDIGASARTIHKTLWLDLADPLSCDPAAHGHTTITPTRGSSGAVYLSWGTIASYDLAVPKLPPGDGEDRIPR